MSRIVTLIALLAILVVKSVFAAAEVTNIPLTPDVPSAMIYMNRSDDRQYSALGTYFVVNTTSSPSVGAFSFIVSRDTTRARLIWWWSTTQPRPTQHDHEGSAVLFEQQNNAYVFAGLGSVPLQPFYYIGVYNDLRDPAAGYFSAMVTFYGMNERFPPGNGYIQLDTRILTMTSIRDEPSIIASWSTVPNYYNYTFYKMSHECGINPLVNDLAYILAHAEPFHHVNFDPDNVPQFGSTKLSEFEDDIDAFCINLIAFNASYIPKIIWLAQTIYYPHMRDRIEPQPINVRAWTPRVWTAIVLTGLLFIGTPIGIIVHRIWLGRHRTKKQQDALLKQRSWVT